MSREPYNNSENSYKLIKSDSELRALTSLLLNEKIVAVDTESNSMHAYREQVCLIQFSTEKANFIVDPFEITDLSPLGELFESASVEKVFHAAEYDLLCLFRDYGFSFNNLFDTMTAAKFLNVEKIGLGNIIESEFNIKASKKYQKADWGLRPLTDEMLEYARMDTQFLIQLRNSYRKQLDIQGLIPLAEEEFTQICRPLQMEPATLGETFLRNIRKKKLSAKQKSALWRLFVIRDREAQKRNRPHFKVFSDKQLMNIALSLPGTEEELGSLQGMTPRNMRKYGKEFLEAVRAGVSSDYPEEKPRRGGGGRDYSERLEKIKRWRTGTAQESKIAAELIISRDLMFDIARSNPGTREELKELMARVPCRFGQYGDSILDIF